MTQAEIQSLYGSREYVPRKYRNSKVDENNPFRWNYYALNNNGGIIPERSISFDTLAYDDSGQPYVVIAGQAYPLNRKPGKYSSVDMSAWLQHQLNLDKQLYDNSKGSSNYTLMERHGGTLRKIYRNGDYF